MPLGFTKEMDRNRGGGKNREQNRDTRFTKADDESKLDYVWIA